MHEGLHRPVNPTKAYSDDSWAKILCERKVRGKGPNKDYSNKREGFRPEAAGPSYHSNKEPTLERPKGTEAHIRKSKVTKSSNTTTTATPYGGNNEQKNVKTDCHWRGCKQKFCEQDRLVKHNNHEHIAANKKSLSCKWEDCTRKEKPFQTRYKLINHMRHHTGERPYGCYLQVCNKDYSHLEDLKTHLRSHTGEKPYTCM